MTNRAEVAVIIERIDEEIEPLMKQIETLQHERMALKLRRRNEIVLEISEDPDLNDADLAQEYDVEEGVIRLARNRIRQIRSEPELVPSSRIAREHYLSTETVDMIRGIGL